MASTQFGEFWSNPANYQFYQQYYKSANVSSDYYKQNHQQYQQNEPSGYYGGKMVKMEAHSSCDNEKYNTYQMFFDNSMTPPPSTPNSGPVKTEFNSDLTYQYDPCRYNPNPKDIDNFLLESPPKTPCSTTKNDTPEKCDSPALRALLTRKGNAKPTSFYQNKEKEPFGTFYEKSNYYNSPFCAVASPPNNYEERKETEAPPMAMVDHVNSAERGQSAESLSVSNMVAGNITEYSQQQQEGDSNMAVGDGEIFPWMKTTKGKSQLTIVNNRY